MYPPGQVLLQTLLNKYSLSPIPQDVHFDFESTQPRQDESQSSHFLVAVLKNLPNEHFSTHVDPYNLFNVLVS